MRSRHESSLLIGVRTSDHSLACERATPSSQVERIRTDKVGDEVGDEEIVKRIGTICSTCGKRVPTGPFVSVTPLGAPVADALVLPTELQRLVEIARRLCAETCVCRDPLDFIRASAECVCETCGKFYRQHPRDRRPEALGYDGEPFLHVICGGQVVKL